VGAQTVSLLLCVKFELSKDPYLYIMQLERLDNEILVRIPADQDSEKLQEMLDLIRYTDLKVQQPRKRLINSHQK